MGNSTNEVVSSTTQKSNRYLVTNLIMMGDEAPIMYQIYKERYPRFHQFKPRDGYSIVRSYLDAILTENRVAEYLKAEGSVKFLDENRLYFDVGGTINTHGNLPDIEVKTARGTYTVEVKRKWKLEEVNRLTHTITWTYFAYDSAEECLENFKANYLHGADSVAVCTRDNHITLFFVKRVNWSASAILPNGKRVITVRY